MLMIESRSLNVSLALVVVVVAAVAQGSPLAREVGTPVSFAAVGSYAMGAAGTALVYVRCVILIRQHIYLLSVFSFALSLPLSPFIYISLSV